MPDTLKLCESWASRKLGLVPLKGSELMTPEREREVREFFVKPFKAGLSPEEAYTRALEAGFSDGETEVVLTDEKMRYQVASREALIRKRFFKLMIEAMKHRGGPRTKKSVSELLSEEELELLWQQAYEEVLEEEDT